MRSHFHPERVRHRENVLVAATAQVRKNWQGWIAGLVVAVALVLVLDWFAAARPYSGAIGAATGSIVLLIVNRRSV